MLISALRQALNVSGNFMRHLAISILITFLLTSCIGVGIDGHEEHMTKDCKCEDFSSLVDNVSVKGGNVQGCAKKIGDSLKWGFIVDNDACDPFLPFIYDDVKSFSCGLAPVAKNKLWGAIDTTGQIIIDYKYFDLSSFSDSIAAFSDTSNKWGFISINGDTIVKPKYKYVSACFAHISLVQNFDGHWNVINSNGDQLPIKVDSLVQGYYLNDYDKNDLALSWGYMGDRNKEFFDYPIYSNGRKVKLVAFDNHYSLLSDTTDTSIAKSGADITQHQQLFR
jgi:hypothetical protein